MNHKKHFLCLIFLLQCCPAVISLGQEVKFGIQFDTAFSMRPVSGRVYVILKDKMSEELFEPEFMGPSRFFAMDVKNWRPGQKIVFSEKAMGYPFPITQLHEGKYIMQAVVDIQNTAHFYSLEEGNGYSEPEHADLKNVKKIDFLIKNRTRGDVFKGTREIKEVSLKSPMLSKFYDQPIALKAAIILPESYESNPTLSYPTVYIIPPFGETHNEALGDISKYPIVNRKGVEKIYVVLNPDCPTGHHQFADSPNNGPRGKSLIEEWIPYIEKHFRAISAPDARFLFGYSSGAWSSVWLQVNYPDFFGGAWSLAPDPIDFKEFQTIDLYNPESNVFWQTKEKLRSLERLPQKVKPTYKQISDYSEVIGTGQQLSSYEAVFSQRDKQGKPMKLWDRNTGKINPKVAQHWINYDIRKIVEDDQKTLIPKLNNKLHIFVGDSDTFYLDMSVISFGNMFKKAGGRIEIDVLPGQDHYSIYSDQKLMTRISSAIDSTFFKTNGKTDDLLNK